MKIIIRDDDTSFFTRPGLLEQVYGRLWARGVPVALAVIPAQFANVRVLHRPEKNYDPSIPPEYRGLDEAYPVTENVALCDYLNGKAAEGLVEICLHGYSHTYMEYETEDRRLIGRKLAEGKGILEEAFPDADIKTFIAPYDRVSPVALEMILEAGFDVCTNSENLKAIPALAHIDAYQRHLIDGGRVLYTCDEYLFTHREDPADCLAHARSRLQSENLLITANHYWTFFYDWDGANRDLQAAWDQFVDDLLARDDATFMRFRDD